MTDFGNFASTDSPSPAHTLSELHLRAERRNARRAVMQHWAGTQWHETPPWRFYRQVIRVGLYLRERLGVGLGDRVVLVSPVRPERVLVEWAAVVQGGVAIALAPDLSDAELAVALTNLVPKAVFVAGSSERARVLASHVPAVGAERVLVFDSPAGQPTADGAAASEPAWAEVLDLGGTLDTAERAQKFRARARAIEPDAPAIGYAQTDASGSMDWKFASHGDVVGQIARFRLRSPARDGDLAYVAGTALSMGALVAVWAFVADGQTSVAFGTPGREGEQIVELRPHRIVAPRDVVERALGGVRGHSNGYPAVRTWLRRVPALAPWKRWIRPTPHDDDRAERLREGITLDGTRVEPRNRTTGDA